MRRRDIMVASVSGESRDMIFDPFVVFLMYPTEVPVFIEDISIGGLENSYGQDCSEVSPSLSTSFGRWASYRNLVQSYHYPHP